ncbi:hypothetical protein C8J56DRAFT_931046 [Mycena floridula]|nr:hypothetical protein C8J56DRAFT_931046 [Mycena floridula]
MAPSGEPTPSPKPAPIGNMAGLVLFTTCTMCILFLLWRRADTLKSVVSYRLKTWREPEGTIRLNGDEEQGSVVDEDSDEDDDMPLPGLRVDNSRIIQLPPRS